MHFNNCLIPADVTGTGVWRLLWPLHAISSDRNISTSVLSRPVLDPNYYSGMNMLMFQRLVNNQQRQIFERVLLPAAKRFGMWLIANVDDCLHADEIPVFNVGREAYNNDDAKRNVAFTIENSDMMIVTTDTIKEYYHTKFGVPLKKIIKIPNYLPEWEFGGKFSEQKVMELWTKNNRKPRIGIISSSSHFNTNPNSPIKDDLDIIINLIHSTLNKYQWVFLGHLPLKIEPLVKQGLVEYRQGADIYNYPLTLSTLDVNCVIAPLVDTMFNRCKSNIKILECAALGYPFFVQNLDPYAKYTPYTFDNEEDLAKKLDSFFRQNKYFARDIARKNFEMLNTPHPEGNGWWMRPNLQQWHAVFTIRQNTCTISVNELKKALPQPTSIIDVEGEIK